MNCTGTRRLLPLLDQGGLPPRRSEALVNHLQGCSACRLRRSEYEEMLSLLARYQEPSLPEGFTGQLRVRLEAEARRAPGDDTRPLPVLEREPRHRRTLRALAYLAAGLVLGALGLWGTLRLGGQAPWGSSPEIAAHGATHGEATDPQEADATLGLGEVAVVTLILDAVTHHPDAVLEVVLPDGLSLVGEGLVKLEEKALRWTESLRPGENLIRVPVKAQRTGTWTLVARTTAGTQELTSTARLRVTRS